MADTVEIGETLPAAIAAITTEEDRWQMIHFAEGAHTQAIVEVGRLMLDGEQGAQYYRRVLNGSSSVRELRRLKEVEPEIISPALALSLRNQHDYKWAVRPMLARTATSLWQASFFEPFGQGGLFGYLEMEGNTAHPDMCCVVRIGADGEIAVRIDDPTYLDSSVKKAVITHEYRILPSKPYSVHEVHFEGDVLPQQRKIFGTGNVPGQVDWWLEYLEQHVAAKAA